MQGSGARNTGEVEETRFATQLFNRLEKLKQIEPVGLADLFQQSMNEGGMPLALRHTLQNFLLKRTIGHARANTNFYAQNADYAQWIEVKHGSAPDLSCWPTIDRQCVVDNFDEFIANDVHLRSVCHSSGTTGIPLNVYKSFEEVEFLGSYYKRLFQNFLSSLSSRPLMLAFPNFYHGVPVPLPSIGLTFVSGVTDDTLIQDALIVLRNTHNVPGHDSKISILSGLAHHVLFFTSYLLQQGIDPRSFELSGINITGGYAASHWREFLCNSWGTVVNDRFTLTEAIGGASRCYKCGQFHLDPHLIGEVIDVDTGECVQQGIGELAITNLYPFVQMQPLLRYRTGDLVNLSYSETCTLPHFEYLGKVKNCVRRVRAGRSEWLIFSAKLHDILLSLPDLNVYNWFVNVTVVRDGSIGSMPVLSIVCEEKRGSFQIRMVFELRYAPHCYDKRLQEVRALLVSAVRDELNTQMAHQIDTGEVVLDVDFVGPGTMKKVAVFKI